MRYLRAFFYVLLVSLFATSAFADDDDNRRVSKKQKYSDKGAKCKSVRSGNAALCGRAMLGSDGMTLVELNTNDPNGRPAGTILTLKIKPKHQGEGEDDDDDDGDFDNLKFENVNAQTFSVPIQGLDRNDEIKVEAKIRGLDGKKREINIKFPVLNRPNLAVVSIDAPAEARMMVPVIVTAMVVNNGEFGANADCALLVDGVQVDGIPQIWVDVGGVEVGCQMTYTFTTGGAKTLQVNLNNIVPGDFDSSDNTASTQIIIVSNFSGYNAFASERATTTVYLDGSRPTRKTVLIRSALNGTMGPLDFASLNATADEYTGAAHITSTIDLKLQPNGCLKSDQDRLLLICHAPTGETDFSLSRQASVTYQSTGVDPAGGETYIIISSQGNYAPFGSTYEFRVRVWDLTAIYEANPIMNLIETNTTWVSGVVRFTERLLIGRKTGP